MDRPRDKNNGRPQYNLASPEEAQNDAPTAPAKAVMPNALARFAAHQPEAAINSFSGAAAGMASGIVTCPLDVIKTKLQSQGGLGRRLRNTPGVATGARPSYHGLLGTAAVIWREDGIRGMYRGLSPMLLGYLPTWAVYMTAYGAARDYYYTQIGKTPALAPLRRL